MPEMKTEETNPSPTGRESEVCAAFKEYAAELDARHDRRERLIKLSRDITIESKRIIFFLHSLVKKDDRRDGLELAEKRIHALVSGPLVKAASEGNLGGFHAVSPGLQELAEAYCLLHHLRNPAERTLPQWTGLTELVSQTELKKYFTQLLSPMDFMLGVADYTGELMRLCINSIAEGDLDACFTIKDILQHLYTNFLGVNVFYHRDMNHKIIILRQSLLKVETTCFDLKLRGQHAFLFRQG